MKKLASFIISLALIVIIAVPAYADDKGNTKFQSFNKAKKVLLKQVYHDHRTTFYCQCPFTKDKRSCIQVAMAQRKNGNGLIVWSGSI